MNPRVSCRELVEFLDDYLSGTLPPERREVFNSHLAGCPSCVSYMKTYRETQALARAASRDDALPADVPEDLVRAILASRPG